MKAAVWHGRKDIRIDEVPAAKIQEPTDAIIRITPSGRGRPAADARLAEQGGFHEHRR